MYIDYYDMAEKVILESHKNGFHAVEYEETERGCSLNNKIPGEPGFYAIYYKNNLMYLGTGSDIRYRIYRFVKEILGKSHSRENHSAAKKFRRYYGIEGLNDCRVGYFKWGTNKKDRESVEKILIRRLKPLLNKNKK
jgi:hypothetical protein